VIAEKKSVNALSVLEDLSPFAVQISTCLFMPKGLQASCQSVQCAVLKVFVFLGGFPAVRRRTAGVR
jgi:hypothetical protein